MAYRVHVGDIFLSVFKNLLTTKKYSFFLKYFWFFQSFFWKLLHNFMFKLIWCFRFKVYGMHITQTGGAVAFVFIAPSIELWRLWLSSIIHVAELRRVWISKYTLFFTAYCRKNFRVLPRPISFHCSLCLLPVFEFFEHFLSIFDFIREFMICRFNFAKFIFDLPQNATYVLGILLCAT